MASLLEREMIKIFYDRLCVEEGQQITVFKFKKKLKKILDTFFKENSFPCLSKSNKLVLVIRLRHCNFLSFFLTLTVTKKFY